MASNSKLLDAFLKFLNGELTDETIEDLRDSLETSGRLTPRQLQNELKTSIKNLFGELASDDVQLPTDFDDLELPDDIELPKDLLDQLKRQKEVLDHLKRQKDQMTGLKLPEDLLDDLELPKDLLDHLKRQKDILDHLKRQTELLNSLKLLGGLKIPKDVMDGLKLSKGNLMGLKLPRQLLDGLKLPKDLLDGLKLPKDLLDGDKLPKDLLDGDKLPKDLLGDLKLPKDILDGLKLQSNYDYDVTKISNELLTNQAKITESTESASVHLGGQSADKSAYGAISNIQAHTMNIMNELKSLSDLPLEPETPDITENQKVPEDFECPSLD